MTLLLMGWATILIVGSAPIPASDWARVVAGKAESVPGGVLCEVACMVVVTQQFCPVM